jgi:protein-disulfide isomerase
MKSTDRAARTLFVPMLAGWLMVAAWAPAGAAPSAGTAGGDDLHQLREEVQQLKAQQQQILDSLDELKKLVKGNAGPPSPKAPDKVSVAGEAFRGENVATVVLIEYGDFQCPFCRRFEHDTYPMVYEAYIKTGKLKYFYRDFPLSFHEHAMPAARASHCAAEQGKFWEMHDGLLMASASLTPSDIDDKANRLGLDVKKLDACMASDHFADVIQRSLDEANSMQITGTPTFLIGTIDANGNVVSVKRTVVGAMPFNAFKAAIDPLLLAAAGPAQAKK